MYLKILLKLLVCHENFHLNTTFKAINQ